MELNPKSKQLFDMLMQIPPDYKQPEIIIKRKLAAWEQGLWFRRVFQPDYSFFAKMNIEQPSWSTAVL